MRLLVDGDIVAYQIACVNEQTIVWDEELTTKLLSPPGEAEKQFDSAIKQIQLSCRLADGEPILCFSSHPNFRYSVLPTYKHNRVDKAKPELLERLIAHAEKHFETRTKPNLEADDVLGILSTKSPKAFIIATLDKDLDQIPGWHYNWRKERTYLVDRFSANLAFYTQILTGDSTDGYSGCPGTGPKKAAGLLVNAAQADWWAVIKAAYAKKGLTEEDALQQARVARILQATDYDFDKGEVILWTPQ